MGWQDSPIVGQGAAQPAAPQAPAAPPKWQDAPVVGQTPQQSDPRVGRVSSFVTGEGRTEYPDMGNIDSLQMPLGRMLANAGFLAATDNDQKMQILQKHLPGVKFTQDKFGNPIVNYDGQQAYLNKPGLQGYDVLNAGAQGMAFALGLGGLSKAAPVLAKVPGLAEAAQVAKAIPVAGKLLPAAASAAGVSAGMDVAAHAGGADKVVDLPRAGVSAGLGAAAQALSPVANAAYRWLRGVFQAKPFFDLAGNLTQDAQVVLQRAGVNAAAVSDEFKQLFAKLAKDATDPTDAAKVAQAQTLPVPVPQTRGNVTGLPSDQMTESLAAKGAYGADAENTMRGVIARQQEALRGNVDAIQTRLGGGQVVERGQGGAQAQQALVEAQQRTKAATSAAYKAAEGAPALVTADGVRDLATRVGQALEPYGSMAPGAKEKLADLANLGLGQNDSAAVKALFDWRRRTSELARAAPNATEAAALSKMLKEFDGSIEETVKQSLMSGDQEAAKKWLQAIAIRKGEARRFQSNDLIADLLETEYAGGRSRLKVAPEAAANFIFGKADLGLASQPELARDLSRLKGRLGADSDAWRALKEEAWLRFANQGNGAMQGAERAFSGGNFKKAWDQAWHKNGATMRVLFDEPERKLIDTFAEVAARTTGKVAGGDNPSGTTIALANVAQKLAKLPIFGEKAALLLSPIIGATVKINQRMQLGQQIANPIAQRALPPATIQGAALGPGRLILESGQSDSGR